MGPRSLRRVLLPLGTLLLFAALLVTLARFVAPETTPGFALVAFTPWAVPGFGLALLCFGAVLLFGHRRPGAALAALVSLAGLVLQVVALAPDFLGGRPTGTADLTVLQLNMHFGGADPAAVARLADDSGADVVVLEETTPRSVRAVRADLPFALSHTIGPSAAGGQHGIQVFSRYPITGAVRLGVSAGGFAMRVQAPRPFWLEAVHLGQPLVSLHTWQHDLLLTSRAAARLHGPRIVVGDLNATLDQPALQALLGTGLVDAARQADSGWQPTWPGDQGPPLLRQLGLVRIDHVLVGGGITTVSTATAGVPDTDHRALVARLHLPVPGR